MMTLNVQKFDDGYYVTRGEWRINGPFDNETDAQEFIDDMTHENLRLLAKDIDYYDNY